MSNNEWILVGQAKNGDSHAFAKLYEKYYKDLYRFAFSYMKGSYETEDVVSTAILKAYENLPKLRKNDSFKSWIFQIVANECKRALNSKVVYLEDASVPEPSGKESAYDNVAILDMIKTLSDDEKLVILLSVFAGYNSKEIAGVVGKKEGSVRSLKSRALEKLKNTCKGGF